MEIKEVKKLRKQLETINPRNIKEIHSKIRNIKEIGGDLTMIFKSCSKIRDNINTINNLLDNIEIEIEYILM